MKKTLSVLLTLCLVAALCVPALASGEMPSGDMGGASMGPASLTWSESAAISREKADVYIAEGSEELQGMTIYSADDDYTAVFAEGGTLSISDFTILTTGREAQSPNTTMHFADANFYGTGAAVLAGSGAELEVLDSVIVTAGEGANLVFCYGGEITVTNTVLLAFGNENAHGVDAVQGGIIHGENIEVYTSGINSGAAATDTGGGTIDLKDSCLGTAMSPGVYIDGDGAAILEDVTIKVGFDREGNPVDQAYMVKDGADGIADETKDNTAEGLVLTGNAVITADDCDVIAPYGVKFHSQSATTQVGILTMTGGSIESSRYDVLYVTGANGSGVLEGVSCTVAQGRYLIRVCNLVPANLNEPGVGAKICAGTGEFTLKNGVYEGDVWALNAEEEEDWGAQLDDASRYDNSLKLTLDAADWSGAAIHVTELTLCGNSVWQVTGQSDVAELIVEAGSCVELPGGCSVTVGGETVRELTEGSYTDIVIVF